LIRFSEKVLQVSIVGTTRAVLEISAQISREARYNHGLNVWHIPCFIN